MIQKRFDEIGKDDILRLVADQVPEGRTLDYKQKLPERNDKAKKGYLADVSAFANAGGGDLIFGVEEKRDAQNNKLGIPERADGLANIGTDDETRRLGSIANSGLDPRIPGFCVKAIDGFTNGPVIIVRVPKSWAGPHMITQGDSRFYVRSNNANHPMDVREIRAAFEGAAGVTERMQRFVWDRLGRIVADETPVPLNQKARFVLHFIPLAAFESGFSIDIQRAIDLDRRMKGDGQSYQRFNFDGRLQFGPEASGLRSCGYTQLFRNGAVESVTTTAMKTGAGARAQIVNQPPKVLQWIVPGLVERDAMSAISNYLEVMRMLAVPPPFYVVTSWVGVRGYRVHDQAHAEFDHPGFEIHPIERDQFSTPEMLIEGTTANAHEVLRPAFDAMWQASGYSRCLNYTDKGDYRRRD